MDFATQNSNSPSAREKHPSMLLLAYDYEISYSRGSSFSNDLEASTLHRGRWKGLQCLLLVMLQSLEAQSCCVSYCPNVSSSPQDLVLFLSQFLC